MQVLFPYHVVYNAPGRCYPMQLDLKRIEGTEVAMVTNGASFRPLALMMGIRV